MDEALEKDFSDPTSILNLSQAWGELKEVIGNVQKDIEEGEEERSRDFMELLDSIKEKYPGRFVSFNILLAEGDEGMNVSHYINLKCSRGTLLTVLNRVAMEALTLMLETTKGYDKELNLPLLLAVLHTSFLLRDVRDKLLPKRE